MLVGAQNSGFPSSQVNQNEAYESQFGLEAGDSGCRSGEHVILSKSSLTPEAGVADPHGFAELVERGFSVECARSRASPSFFGEPATPNGSGDSITAQSPVSHSHPNYNQRQIPFDPLAGEPALNTNSQRRWYGSSCDGSDVYAEDGRLSAPAATARHMRFTSVQGGNAACITSAFAPAAGSASANSTFRAASVGDILAQLSVVHARAQMLEHELQKQRSINEILTGELQDRDAELSALRAELRRVKGAQQEPAARQDSDAPVAAPGRGLQVGFPSRLQRAREELCRQQEEQIQHAAAAVEGEAATEEPQELQAAADAVVAGVPHPASLFHPSGCPLEVPAPPCTPPPPHLEAAPLPEALHQEEEPLDAAWPAAPAPEPPLSLPRLDTPQAFDTLVPPAADLASPTAATAAEHARAATLATLVTATAETAASPPAPLRHQRPQEAPPSSSPFLPSPTPFMAAAAAAAALEAPQDGRHHQRYQQHPRNCPHRRQARQDLQDPREDQHDSSSSKTHITASSFCTTIITATDGHAPESGASRSCSSLLWHPLLEEERRRTDRAHTALLCSSRQAQRLSQQVAALRAHAEALKQELRDWRSACLDNHRKLARLRRAAEAGAGAGAQRNVENGEVAGA